MDKKTSDHRGSAMEMVISEKIRELIKKAGTTANLVAKGTGIDNANFYRMLKNERHWRIGHLEKVCEFLGTTVEDVVGAPIEVPVVSTISALETFPYPSDQIDQLTFTGEKIEYKGKVKGKMLKEGLYALKVGDRSMMPAFKAGTTFIVERESDEDIKDDDLVVCPDEKGEAQLCRVQFIGDLINLHPLNPAMSDKSLPRNHLKLCDRVILIDPTTL